MNANSQALKQNAVAIEGADIGQGFSHQLSMNRDWNEAMNALHYILLRKWYYIGIVTNTKMKSNKLLKHGVEFSRRRTKVDVGLNSILDLRENSYLGLKKKIRDHRQKTGKNNDIWHFSSNWKELPAGTCLVELHQSLLRTLLGKKDVRNAFVVFDGKASVKDQNSAMMIINKVLTEKEFTEKLLEKAKNDQSEPCLTKQVHIRQPELLIRFLQENFIMVISSVIPEEKILLDKYFDHLKLSGQQTGELDTLQKKVLRAWAHM
ncbi:MAG: hypothetical protein QNL04_14195 [SAR324 cluster bacterium]|nr:hypothetical protein [SAR324 cluster bacterium]